MKRRVRSAANGLARLLVLVLVSSIALAVAGLVYAASTGAGARSSVASALFIGGGVLVVGNALAGGGARGVLDQANRSGASVIAPAMPFGWVVVRACVIGAGVVALAV